MMPMNSTHICPVCNSKEIDIFFTLNNVPVFCNILYDSKEKAIQAQKGDIGLGFCNTCGHIYNYAFDPSLLHYSQKYENSLHFSPRFQEYSRRLVQSLYQKYDLNDKTIIDIGCGKGDFLRQICSIGNNRGFGFDPSFEPQRHNEASDVNLTFIQDLYGEKYSDYVADLICCRHVLEHIESPNVFIKTVADSSKANGSLLFFEVPNALFTIEDLAIWDLIYEHCSYFTANSLAYLFEINGYKIENIQTTFDDQFLTIEAVYSGNGKKRPSKRTDSSRVLKGKIAEFSKSYAEKFSKWRRVLLNRKTENRRGVVWGAGSKGVSFLNLLNDVCDIEYAVDINPNKTGKYIAGSGQQVMQPEFLADYRPEYVIIMNPIYVDEIKNQLLELGVDAEIYVDDKNLDSLQLEDS